MFPTVSFLSTDALPGIAGLIELHNSFQIYSYFRFVCGTLLVYDYLLTFSDEANLIWKRGWSLFGVTYYAVKYLPFIDMLILSYFEQYLPHADAGSCEMIYIVYSICTFVGVELANCILILRTYVLWDKDKRILASLGVALLASVAGEAYYLTKYLRSSHSVQLSTVPIPLSPVAV